MKKYIIIIHGWHVSSKGFTEKIIECKTYNEAVIIAQSETYKRESTFENCAYTLIELTEDQFATKKLQKIPKWIRKIFNVL